MHTIEKTYTIKNTYGLHIRPSTAICSTVKKYDSTVKIHYKNQVVDARSVINLLTLSVKHGEDIKIEATGKDAKKVIAELGDLIDNYFGLKEELEKVQ